MSNIDDNKVEERNWMVETQLIKRGITDQAILESMRTVPRHCFVDEVKEQFAYYDTPLAIGQGQTISQPYIVALMIEALKLETTSRVLEIGTGSGYSAAVLSRIAAKVYTVERNEILAQNAIRRFTKLGYDNIEVKIGDGTLGWAEKACFDAILVTAGGPVIPETLIEQLYTNGTMVIPVGPTGKQELVSLHKENDGRLYKDMLGLVRFVPLVGEEGWH